MADPVIRRQAGRDRSGRVPRASLWMDFYQRPQDWAPSLTDEAEGEHPHSAEGGSEIFPSAPYQSNRVLNATADYKVDDINRGGSSGH
jgi:hypothetical protein